MSLAAECLKDRPHKVQVKSTKILLVPTKYNSTLSHLEIVKDVTKEILC